MRFQIEDVRQQRFAYTARVGSKGSPDGITRVDGYADGVFAYRSAPEVAFRWACVLRVIGDWKTPTAIANDAIVAAQLTMEILAFAAATRRGGPVLFVATDLRATVIA